jgi:hypothetical protein
MKAMKRRWRLLLVLLLLLVLGGMLLLPSVRWPIYGWLRGEAFYQGMPTSYWRMVFKTIDHEILYEDLASQPREAVVAELAFHQMQDDSTAVPVLRALLQADHPRMRELAAFLLGCNGPQSVEAVAELVIALRDSDSGVCNEAAKALKKIDPEAAAKAGVK